MTPGGDADAPELPIEADAATEWDAARWRAFFKEMPLADLWRVLQKDKKDKSAEAFIFAGFRVSQEALRKNPVIAKRLVEAAQKTPVFAKAVRDASPASAETQTPEAAPVPPPAGPPPAPPPPLRSAAVTPPEPKIFDAAKAKAQIKTLRDAAQKNAARTEELEAMLKRTERERDTAKAETAMQIAARKAAEAAEKRAHAEKEREARARLRDQAAHTAAQQTQTKPSKPAPSPPAPPFAASASPAAPEETLLYQAAERLLQSGRFGAVSDLCREALRIGQSAAERGRVHFLYAQSFYGANDDANGEAQSRLAVTAFLDSGNAVRAAEALVQRLGKNASVRASDTPLLRRLHTLAQKTNQAEAVQIILTRLRVSALPAWNRLQTAVQGTPAAALLAADTAAAAAIGPDETVFLPGAGGGMAGAALTPRQVVRAVDSGDEKTLIRARAALAALRSGDKSGATLAGAFVEAVCELSPVAACPLLSARTRPVFVDASNVARYKADPLSLQSVPRVLYLTLMRDFLLRRGYFPVSLIADATLRYNVDDKAAYLELIDKQMVRETPPGTSADETLISESLAKSADLVTNDRLSEWGEKAQDVERIGFILSSSGISLTQF